MEFDDKLGRITYGNGIEFRNVCPRCYGGLGHCTCKTGLSLYMRLATERKYEGYVSPLGSFKPVDGTIASFVLKEKKESK